MAVALPNLDDRRWLDLVDEARALIPVYAPEWTDHNAHDPGITLCELLAYLTDSALYRGNQITDRQRLLMLALAGIRPAPATAARTVFTFRAVGPEPVPLPATTELANNGIRYRIRRPLTVTAAAIGGVWTRAAGRLVDLSSALARGDAIDLFGRQPAAGVEFLIGISGPVPPGDHVSLYFEIEDAVDRRAIVLDRRESVGACRDPFPCGRPPRWKPRHTRASRTHHDARVTWEYLDGQGTWQPLGVRDETRAFTLSGAVTVQVPDDPVAQLFEDRTVWMIRARLASGELDAPATARRLWFNAVEAEQAVAVDQSLFIAADAVVEGTPPPAGTRTRLRLELAGRTITRLEFDHDSGPAIAVLEFTPPAKGQSGRLVIGAAVIGTTSGLPNLQVTLDGAPLSRRGFELWSIGGEAQWERWYRRDDLISSRRDARDFALDEQNGVVRFGDGLHGHVPDAGAALVAVCSLTAAGGGNTTAGPLTIPDSPRNRALLGDINATRDALALLEQPAAASGGADREPVIQTAARAAVEREATSRAVTIADIEFLVKRAPGARIARVKAWANTSPDLAGFDAPGLVTIVIAPAMPVARPAPSPGLRRTLERFLARRRPLGTRFEIVAARYRTVSVRATVRALPGHAAAAVARRVATALDLFLDPLRGGKDGEGWPFGRDVYRSEILEWIDGLTGVDHVLSLELVADDGAPQCGNICLSPLMLTTPGAHRIEVD